MRYCPACHSVFPNDFRTCPKDQAELRTASDLQPGMVLRGKYEVLDKVGAGGMASVYRARHLAFNEVCAIKVVAGRLADDEDFLRRFRNEAVVARRFQHPHAVRVDDLDTTEDGRPFIVMEYVDGPNLREVVRREGALGLRRALTIARQVASALAAAHGLGIVHRDIKPDNILLAGTGAAESAKVLDFGIAKVKEGFFGDGDHVATRTGAVVGTPQYISPEQALGRRGDELDGRADLYSLGVVLYEMVTGRLPFESDTAMGIILHHLQTMPTPPHEVRPDLGIPEPLSAVLLRMLDKDRARRFASAHDLITALDEVLELPLPERAVPADAGFEGARPITPRPVPMDIDSRETRVMPRTPPMTTGVPMPTRIPTPTAAPTLHMPLPVPGTPLPRTTTPPPLPSGFGTLTARRSRRGPPGWLKWMGIALAGYFVTQISSERRASRRAAEQAAPAPAAQVAGEVAPPDDDRIESEVERILDESPTTHNEAIYVDVDDGQVTLTGHVHEREVAQLADRLTRGVAGVTGVSNELELRAAGDHRRTVPPAEAVRAIPPAPPGAPEAPHMTPPPMPDAALRALTHDLPIAELVSQGREMMNAGDPEGAMAAFTGALSLDPSNRDASQGVRDAGRALKDKALRDRQRGRQAPRGPQGPLGPQRDVPSPPSEAP